MAKGDLYGYIDCCHCPAPVPNSMSITEDKNGSPFGYCVECSGQLRVGGNKPQDKRRVKLFFEKYPHLKQAANDEGATSSQSEPVADSNVKSLEPETKATPAKKSALASGIDVLVGAG